MLYIITSVHNRYNITEKFIEQLNSQTYKKFHLILVDDGSTDGTEKMVKQKLKNSTILHGDGNLWWAGGLQKAYLYLKKMMADTDMVYICNDDITIPNDFLEKAVALLRKNEKYLLCAQGINDKTGEIEDSAIIRDPKTAKGIMTKDGELGNCCSTRSLFMMGNTYKEIGGMHPILLPHYRSDYEYTIRAARKGHPCVSYSELNYLVHMDSTGNAKAKSLKEKFSKKYYNNPIYNLNFILMVTPLKDLPKYICNLIKKIYRGSINAE